MSSTLQTNRFNSVKCLPGTLQTGRLNCVKCQVPCLQVGLIVLNIKYLVYR